MKKEVYLLSGFLGSGKTTLLKKFLLSLKVKGLKPAVLMNELGKTSIDSNEVDDDTPLKELLDGCICCTIQEKLESQLQELLLKEDFDVLVIETTGAAHPVEVVDSVLSPLFAQHLSFKGIITIVDAFQWKNRDQFSPQILHLMREQIRHANLIILNKADLLPEMELGAIVFELQQLNEASRVLLTNYCDVSMTEIHQLVREERDVNHRKASIGKQLSLTACVHTFENKINLEEFEEWLRKLPSTIYRIKGYLPVVGKKYPYLFQYSYGMPYYMPEQIKMPANLVIIGENLHKQEILEGLKGLEK
ncbi:G3E family GTPase [Bacillus pakistanensis]|uniref:G3E family GTPase n=1 Tax=Rossellomorea pakistanensis TaxID=992288 RepID=A0ABS2N9H5_9BACI|nr:GTP-binding protein [Bacillus pakistanensis]MBM7584216.1 G3E family GTPase [Bacillus pakistanensis]